MNPSAPLTLFIIKKTYNYGNGGASVSSGLKTSAMFSVALLHMEGFRAHLEEAVDGNSIDAIVTKYRPARVVLEAIWVTPDKLAELRRLHPSIRWTVRVHSETPFLAQEGLAVKWLTAYMAQGVEVAFNSAQTVSDFAMFGATAWLPNWYILRRPREPLPDEVLDVGCFGAIRPLKNQLIQALAAISYARSKGVPLNFHMNGSRIEQNGSNSLKNIVAAFDAAGKGNQLVLHNWMPHAEFLELVARMDICLQVSLTESFNITSADAVSMGVPLVGSSAISWLPTTSMALVDSVLDIVNVMGRADQAMVTNNQHALRTYLVRSELAWYDWMRCP